MVGETAGLPQPVRQRLRQASGLRSTWSAAVTSQKALGALKLCEEARCAADARARERSPAEARATLLEASVASAQGRSRLARCIRKGAR